MKRANKQVALGYFILITALVVYGVIKFDIFEETQDRPIEVNMEVGSDEMTTSVAAAEEGGPPTKEEDQIEVIDSSKVTEPEQLVDLLIKAYVNQDVKLLQQLSAMKYGDYFTESQMEDALNVYGSLFEHQTVINYIFEEDDPYMEATKNYRLYGDFQLQHRVHVQKLDGSWVIYDPIMYYSGFIRHKLDQYVEAIQEKDAHKLAQITSTDHTLQNLDSTVAQVCLLQYHQQVDVANLRWKAVGLDAYSQKFAYELYDSLDDKGFTHTINVKYGDGQVEIEDQWMMEENL